MSAPTVSRAEVLPLKRRAQNKPHCRHCPKCNSEGNRSLGVDLTSVLMGRGALHVVVVVNAI